MAAENCDHAFNVDEENETEIAPGKVSPCSPL